MDRLSVFFCLSCYLPSYVVLCTWHGARPGCLPDFMARGIPFLVEVDVVLA